MVTEEQRRELEARTRADAGFAYIKKADVAGFVAIR